MPAKKSKSAADARSEIARLRQDIRRHEYLYFVIDEPENVVRAIFKHYETRGFEPSEAEREKQLYL